MSDPSLPRGINHIGITVPDLDEATRFLQEGLGAKVAYDGLTDSDAPRCGAQTEQQLGLPQGSRIRRQRMIVAGTGPSLEMFEIDGPSRPAAGLVDYGLNHIAFYVDDIDAALERLVEAGGRALSDVHGNSRYEDSPGNGSVYVLAPWGTIIELQTIPAGHYYPDGSDVRVWTPPPRS